MRHQHRSLRRNHSLKQNTNTLLFLSYSRLFFVKSLSSLTYLFTSTEMHQLSALQRTEGMRLELDSDLTLRDSSVIATLPFQQNRRNRYITNAIFQRTKKRWAWFAQARQVNPPLGTLCYLPREIREMIWQAVLHCRRTLSSDGLWEYECGLGPVFDLSAYYFGFGRRIFVDSSIENLRLVSSPVKAEYDAAFLKRPFRFNEAMNLICFLNRMPEQHLSRLNSVDIGVCTIHNLESWLAPIACLPKGLRQIHFRIYPTIPGWYEGHIGKQSLQMLESLVRGASQRVPDAKVIMSSTNEDLLPPQCQVLFEDVLRSP